MNINFEYNRVIPRDLFNESKLLKCIGRLILLIEDRMTPCQMSYEHDGSPFEIGLLDDGHLTIGNISIFINDKSLEFKSTYNSKSNYPLLVVHEYCEYLVFDEEGGFSEEFINFCNEIE